MLLETGSDIKEKQPLLLPRLVPETSWYVINRTTEEVIPTVHTPEHIY